MPEKCIASRDNKQSHVIVEHVIQNKNCATADAPSRNVGYRFRFRPAFSRSDPVVYSNSNVETVRLLPAFHAGICANELGHCYRRMAVCKGGGVVTGSTPHPQMVTPISLYSHITTAATDLLHTTVLSPVKEQKKIATRKVF